MPIADTPTPTVVLRCNAGGPVGLGHLSRCLNLAHALRERGARCTFLLPLAAAPLLERILHSGHLAALVDASTPHLDLAAIATHLVDSPCDWLLVDHYDADAPYLDAAAALAPRLAVLDDLGDRELTRAALVVNPTPGAQGWTQLGESTLLLSGPEYALLDPAFALARAQFTLRPTIAHLAIYLGGALDDALWARVRTALDTHHPEATLTLVAAPGRVPSAARDDARLTVREGLSPVEVAQLFATADLALLPPSTVAWEACCVGIPAVFLPTADNQRRVAQHLARTLGTVTTLDALGTTLTRLAPLEARRALSTIAATLTDGLGASRVAEVMLGRAGIARGS